jgi:hypothetical protein
MFNILDRPWEQLKGLLSKLGNPYYLNPSGVKGPRVPNNVRTDGACVRFETIDASSHPCLSIMSLIHSLSHTDSLFLFLFHLSLFCLSVIICSSMQKSPH